MSGGMEASWHAATTMLKRAPVVTAKTAVVDHRRAARDVSVAAEKHATAAPARAPGAKAPAEAAKDPNSDSHAEGKSETHSDADRVYRNKTRVGSKQPAPDRPRIVIGNVNQSRIDRYNSDHAGVCNNHTLLRRRNQYLRLLRLQSHSLDGVHHVSRLVVIGVAQLRRPGGVLREIIKHRRKLCEALDRRVPSLGVRSGRSLIRGQIHVLVQPRVGRGDLVRICGASQYLSDQGVRIESDRRYQLIQLHRIQLDVGRRRRLRVQVKLRCRNKQHGKHKRHHLAHGLRQGNCALGVHRLRPFSPYRSSHPMYAGVSIRIILSQRNFILSTELSALVPVPTTMRPICVLIT
jgi:hypothetical protein